MAVSGNPYCDRVWCIFLVSTHCACLLCCQSENVPPLKTMSSALQCNFKVQSVFCVMSSKLYASQIHMQMIMQNLLSGHLNILNSAAVFDTDFHWASFHGCSDSLSFQLVTHTQHVCISFPPPKLHITVCLFVQNPKLYVTFAQSCLPLPAIYGRLQNFIWL
jgi:hypothetical protein